MKVKNIKIGDKFKGLVNNEIFEIMEIHKEKDEIIFKNKNKCFLYGLEAFKRYKRTLTIKKILKGG